LPKTKNHRESARSEHINNYINSWIQPYILSHPYYYQTSANFKDFIKDIEKDLVKLNQDISNIIDYDLIDLKLRHEILTKIGADVCPYCNRQYITSYVHQSQPKTTADLDHFLPKSIFQLLSLSLFNFIPSCPICNSRFKLDKGINILYPYEEDFGDDAYFSVNITDNSNVNTLIGLNDWFDLNIEVDATARNIYKINNSIELFKLNQLYQVHKEYVRELLYKRNAYSNSYKNQLDNLFTSMKLDDFEIDLFLYGNFLRKDLFLKRPLSKLAYDIIKRDKS
jgi:hypothetical protein